MSAISYRLRIALRRHPAFLLVAGTVAVGGVLVLTLVAGALRTLSTSDRYEQLQSDYDLTLEQVEGAPRTKEIAALPAVSAVEAASFVFGVVFPEGEEEPSEAITFAGSPVIFGAQLIEGRMPDPSEPGEFFATKSFVEETGAQLGDRFQLVTISSEQAAVSGFEVEQPDGPTLTGTLVGIGDGPAELQDGYSLVAFPESLLDEGDIGVATTQSAVGLRPGATEADLRAQLATLPGETEFGISEVEWVPTPVRAAVNAQAQGLGVVALIVGGAVIAVVGQLLGRQVRLTDEQQLTLRAIGMTRLQVVADRLVTAAVPIVIGIIIATAISIGTSGVFPISFARRVEPDPGVRVDVVAHVVTPLVLALALLGWVWLSLVLGASTPRPRRYRRPGEALTSRLRPPPAAIGARFAFASRRPGLTPASLIGLAVVLAALVGAAAFGTSVGRLIDEPHRYAESDIGLGAGGSEIPREVLEAFQQDADVESITRYDTVSATTAGRTIEISGGESLKGTPRIEVLNGRVPRTAHEVALGRIEARDLGLDVGDELEVSTPSATVDLTVTGIAVVPSVAGSDGIGHGGLVTFEGLTSIEPEPDLGNAAIELRPDAPADTRARISEAIGMEVGRFSMPADIISLTRIRAIPWIVVGALGLLAVLGLAHLLLLSGHHRRRDVAVLRALGANQRWVSSVFHWQATLAALALAVVAIPLGLLAGRAVYRAFIERLGVAEDLAIPWALVAVGLVVLVALANVVAVTPARRACRRPPGSALADE